MIDLRGSRFTDIMPENLASQLETQAFAYALGRQVEKLCINADRVRIYAAVDDIHFPQLGGVDVPAYGPLPCGILAHSGGHGGLNVHGSVSVDVPAACTVTGEVGNRLAVGELSKLVDLIPYMASVSNITVTAGGAEVESDDHLAERVYLFPGSYSTAGPEANYKYHAKKFNVNVGPGSPWPPPALLKE